MRWWKMSWDPVCSGSGRRVRARAFVRSGMKSSAGGQGSRRKAAAASEGKKQSPSAEDRVDPVPDHLVRKGRVRRGNWGNWGPGFRGEKYGGLTNPLTQNHGFRRANLY